MTEDERKARQLKLHAENIVRGWAIAERDAVDALFEKRVIVLGQTLAEAQVLAEGPAASTYDVVAVASPQSLDRLRGFSADAVIYSPDLTGNVETLNRLRAAVAPSLANGRYNELHEHDAEVCICWSLGAYAISTCRGTCHAEDGDE